MMNKGHATTSSNLPSSRSQLFSLDPFARDAANSAPLGSPPTLVIRATSDYTARNALELSFQAGEFFHVTDLFTDDDGAPWFQAENPLKFIRGIVPTHLFAKYGPNRPSKLLAIEKCSHRRYTMSQLFLAFSRDKAFMPSTQSTPPLREQGPSNLQSSGTAEPKPCHARYQSLFGTMKYNFVAERSDELSARYGEPLIVIAHSAQEWFVVKPIGRLGGPGFIPASYLELQEIKTCRSVSSVQAQNLIPNVEEWKKRVARYKACSVDLGVIAAVNSETANAKSKDPVDCSLEEPEASGASHITASDEPAAHNHPMASDDQDPSNYYPAPDEQDSCVIDWRERQAAFIQCAQEDDGLSLVEEEEEDEITSRARIKKRYGTLHTVKVTSFHREHGEFWYQVHAHFQNPNDEAQRRRGLILYRLEAHFATLETDLKSELQNTDQTLPKLISAPPPEDEMACARRLEELRDYVEELCGSSELVRTSEAVCEFLSHRQGDMEYDRDADTASIESTQSSSHLKPPTQQSRSEANKHSTGETLRQTLTMPELMEIGEDVLNWMASCDASPNEVDFAFEEPSYSTQPSSIGTPSPCPSLHIKKSREFSSKSPATDISSIPETCNSR